MSGKADFPWMLETVAWCPLAKTLVVLVAQGEATSSTNHGPPCCKRASARAGVSHKARLGDALITRSINKFQMHEQRDGYECKRYPGASLCGGPDGFQEDLSQK